MAITIREWRTFRGKFTKILDAVGAIDGTSHEIYRPQTEPQQLFYSGHRCYHALHTQLIVDTSGTIRHVESGFPGHLNDAQTLGLMQYIGTDLPFPPECVLLADRIYLNRDPLMTPYTTTQIRRKDAPMCRH